MATNPELLTVLFTLDGQVVEAGQDETILQAALRHGVEIPRLCYAEGMRADGNCRVCVVEIEGERLLAPSCCRHPTNCMRVQSTSSRARRSQALVVELLLADMPGEARTLNCELHLWAERLGVTEQWFMPRSQPAPDASHPAISVNLDACIQCTCCLRTCREVQANDVIGLAYRGSDSKLVFIDPYRSTMARHASYALQIWPDTDVALLNAMMNLILSESLTDEDFIAERTEGFEALAAHMRPFTPEAMAPICGIPASTIREVARLYATAKSAMIFWGMGISQHTHGTDNARCLISLALMTGQIGRPGTGLHPLRGQNSSWQTYALNPR